MGYLGLAMIQPDCDRHYDRLVWAGTGVERCPRPQSAAEWSMGMHLASASIQRAGRLRPRDVMQ